MDQLVPEVGLQVLKRRVMSRLLVPSGHTEHRALGRAVFHPGFERVAVAQTQVHAGSRDREKNGLGEREEGAVARVALLAKRRLDLLPNRGRRVEQIDFRVRVGEAAHARADQVRASAVGERGQRLFGEAERLFLFAEGGVKSCGPHARAGGTSPGPAPQRRNRRPGSARPTPAGRGTEAPPVWARSLT